MSETTVGRDAFEVAIICTLPLEADAVHLVFDAFFPSTVGDLNHHYTHGRIGQHYIVAILLPGIGKANAATAAGMLKASYQNVQLVLLVGVCGGVPLLTKDGDEIILGDVIISNSLSQFDLGRMYPGSIFLPKTSAEDRLGKQNKEMRSLLRSLETTRRRTELHQRTSQILRDLQAAHLKSAPNRRYLQKYDYPGTVHDILFESNYRHRHRGSSYTCCSDAVTCKVALTMTCDECGCDKTHLAPRSECLESKRRVESDDPIKAQDPTIHIGGMASGDTVMKSGEDRDRIAKEEQIIGFEMEEAGIWDEIPCIIIKGVCDYADSHKAKGWQSFAAAAAAATLKAFVEFAFPEGKFSEHYSHRGGFFRTVYSNQTQSTANKLSQGGIKFYPQVPLSPILVTDARGRPLPFYLETISSKASFLYILKDRFKDLGTGKIDRGEWYLEDTLSKNQLDLSHPWQTVMKVPNESPGSNG